MAIHDFNLSPSECPKCQERAHAEHDLSVEPAQCPKCQEARGSGKSASAPGISETPATTPKPTGPRSAEDRALIEAAVGGDARLAKLVDTLRNFTHEQCTTSDALTVIAIARKQLDRPSALHSCGLWLGEAASNFNRNQSRPAGTET